MAIVKMTATAMIVVATESRRELCKWLEVGPSRGLYVGSSLVKTDLEAWFASTYYLHCPSY